MSQIMAEDGATVVLGGLIDEDVQESEAKVPLLGDIPILGQLFRSTTTSKRKRNLMVFIRPTILRDANVYSGVSSNKYTLFRAEQLNLAAEEGYATSPARQVLPAYGQDVMMSPEVQQQIQRMQAQQQATATGVRAQVQGQPFVQSKP